MLVLYLSIRQYRNGLLPRSTVIGVNGGSSPSWRAKQLEPQMFIDFTRFGWGVELSKILGISPQKSTKWMQRYFPDVYENTCFKKKMRG